MIKAVIFDLDGTLANTLSGITHFVNRTTASFGLSSLSQERIKVFVGNGAKVLLERTLNHLGSPELLQEAFSLYNALYNAHPHYDLKEYEGISEMLFSLRQAGIRISVLSNKPHAATVAVCQYLFADNIDFVLGHKEGAPHKPDITPLKTVCRHLGVDMKECAYVGDTDCDMMTGKNADMLTVGVNWGFRDEKELWDNGADYVISHPSQLLSLLKL